MSNGKRLAAALGAAVIVALVCWFVGGPRFRSSVEPTSAESPATRRASELTSPSPAVDPRSVATGNDSSHDESSRSEPASPLAITITGRCVDTQRKPVAEANVALTELAWWNKETGIPHSRRSVPGDPATILARTRSAADGRFSIAVTLPEESPHAVGVTVEARVAGRCRPQVQNFRSGQGDIDVGELVLESGARASGFVHDTLGIPCAGVRMSMNHPNRRTGTLPVRDEALSAADGRFAFDNAPAARCTLEARSDDLREAKLEVDLSSGEPRTDIEVILPELRGADSISGVVTDPDGHPVPNAFIAESETAGPEPRLNISTGCDDRGRFRIDGRPGGVFELTVRDRQARWCSVRRGDVPSGTHDIVIALDGSRSFLLRVRDASGVPVERFGFDRVSSVMYDYVRDELTQHPGGEVRMASDLVPFDLRVVAPGYHSETIAGLDPDHVPAIVDVALRRACLLRGGVSSEGRPAQFARIAIGDSHLLDNAPPRSMLGDARAPEAVTDASGAFELTVEGTGTVRLRAQNGARLAPLTSDIAVKPGEDVAGIAIELATTGSIEGAVFDSTGSPRAGVAVAAASDGKLVEATHADEHGAFRLAGLPPGDYDVTTMLDRGLVHFDTHEPPCVAAAQSWRFHVEPGTTQRADLHLLESARCHLVLAIPNPPQSTWHVETWIHSQHPGADVRDSSLHANDALDVEMIDPFDAEIRIECERFDWPQFRIARQSFDRGTREVSLTVSAGRIEGSLGSPFAADETIKLTWHGSSADARAETTADATGQFVFACAPVGECSLARAARPHSARSVTVKSAETSRLDKL